MKNFKAFFRWLYVGKFDLDLDKKRINCLLILEIFSLRDHALFLLLLSVIQRLSDEPIPAELSKVKLITHSLHRLSLEGFIRKVTPP